MESSVATTITFIPQSDSVTEKDGSKQWKPTSGVSQVTAELAKPTILQVAVLKAQSAVPTTAQAGAVPPNAQSGEGKQTLLNLQQFRFTVDFKKEGSQTFEPYGTGKPKVSSNALFFTIKINICLPNTTGIRDFKKK